MAYDITISLTTAPDDFGSSSQPLTFTSSNTQRTVFIPITNDNVNEGLEEFFANLMVMSVNGNVAVDPSSAVVMIIDDDGKLSI